MPTLKKSFLRLYLSFFGILDIFVGLLMLIPGIAFMTTAIGNLRFSLDMSIVFLGSECFFGPFLSALGIASIVWGIMDLLKTVKLLDA